MKKNFLSKISSIICLAVLSLLGTRTDAQTYCTPSFLQGCAFGNEINDFFLTGESGTSINDPATGCISTAFGGYDNRTGESVTLKQGTSYTVSIDDAVGAPPDNFQVWIDFNNNGTFEATESVAGGVLPLIIGVATGALTPFTLIIPPGATLGPHRMRAEVSASDVYPTVNPCPTALANPDGEVHDYTVVIIAGSSTTCNPPTGLTASSITTTSATVSWTTATGSVGAEYVVNTTATAPAGAGTGTTLSSIPVTGLTAATPYYLHVRDSCGATSLSTWVTIPFTTLSATCDTVTVTITAITATSATVSWAAVTGSVGYQYLINTTAVAPGGSGTNTTALSINPTGLTPGILYYAHVRDSCGATSFSAWVNKSFTTLSTTGIINLNNGTETGFGIVAYPNPVKNTVTVTINGNVYGNAQIQLMDITGKLIKAEAMDNNLHNLDMTGLPNCIYLIRFTDAEHTQTIKINKQ